MKLLKIVLSAALFTVSIAHAEIQPVQPGSDGEAVANVANDIFIVRQVKIGSTAYKVVGMDSKLNGDLSMTVMILVGENGVGGLAGYEAAFQVAPNEQHNSLKSVRKVGDSLELAFWDFEGNVTKKLYKYDSATRTLK